MSYRVKQSKINSISKSTHVLFSIYYIDTDDIPGFFLFTKKIVSSSRVVKILFLSFTCEDIAVAMHN